MKHHKWQSRKLCNKLKISAVLDSEGTHSQLHTTWCMQHVGCIQISWKLSANRDAAQQKSPNSFPQVSSWPPTLMSRASCSVKSIICICANEEWLKELALTGVSTRCEPHIQSLHFPLILGEGGHSARFNSYSSASVLTTKMPPAGDDTCAPDYGMRWFIMTYKGTLPLEG